MPTPRSNRPIISIAIFIANALIIAPKKKLNAPQIMLAFRPLLLVKWDAANVKIRAPKYNEDVNSVSIWLSYLQ
jgi:hypothetical protein